uniref:Fibronectin type-III domain-containing protein n=1 Tax=Monopterus albus TaxID=43700 RepID=A0A3Q3KBJ8_MONAL
MAAVFGSVTVTFILCVLGGHALDLMRATATLSSHPPTPTVHCWCASYPNLTLCSWPSESSHSPPSHYIATYRYHIILCLFQLWHCQLPSLKLLTDYIINVTAVYSAGSSSHLASFMLEDIVKPDPPVNIRVSPHNIRNLLVEWSPPPTWADLQIFPLKYQIRYQWENRGIPKSVNLGPFESTSVELKGLTPGRAYLFQVCAKELLGLGKCSNWSSPIKITIPRTKP